MPIGSVEDDFRLVGIDLRPLGWVDHSGCVLRDTHKVIARATLIRIATTPMMIDKSASVFMGAPYALH